MAKQGEIDYLTNIGPDGIQSAANKPFSDPECGRYLIELGAVMMLLPPPPARLLDIGCGTGWTSRFFAQRGYDVVGIDIAPDMIAEARRCAASSNLPNLRFEVCDYETIKLANEFDAAVFFDSLHHAVDERQAIEACFQALRPGAVCVLSEPGTGHAEKAGSLDAVARYDVTEKDMPPQRIMDLAARAGFSDFRVVPHANSIGDALFGFPVAVPADEFSPQSYRAQAAEHCQFKLSALEDSGIVRMVKPLHPAVIGSGTDGSRAAPRAVRHDTRLAHATFASGWHSLEQNGPHWLRWLEGEGHIDLVLRQSGHVTILGDLALVGAPHRTVTITVVDQPDQNRAYSIPCRWFQPFSFERLHLPAGRFQVVIRADGPLAPMSDTDDRAVRIGVRDWIWRLDPD